MILNLSILRVVAFARFAK